MLADPGPQNGDHRNGRLLARLIGELRRGDPVVIHNAGRAQTIWAADSDPARTGRLNGGPGGPPGEPMVLLIGRHRAERLRLTTINATDVGATDVAVRLPVAPGEGIQISWPELVRMLCDPGQLTVPAAILGRVAVEAVAPGSIDALALALARQAGLMPAVMSQSGSQSGSGTAMPTGPALFCADGTLAVDADRAWAAVTEPTVTVHKVADATVPLAGAEAARILAFSPGTGAAEHLAIVIGDIDPARPVLCRLHSSCFTGDVLASLRCDCGDQLRGAISRVKADGGGIICYLSQEGRGIGLANKLRAYALQDRGLDTLDANLQLGFGADERDYAAAASMLRALGITAVRLLTNNPRKAVALGELGISVVDLVQHAFPPSRHNEAYLQTKADRFGHRLFSNSTGRTG